MLGVFSFTRGRRQHGAGVRQARHHCIISGTGRAGTSFLVQLLTRLKLDTGFTEQTLVLDKNGRAGLELNILSPDAPYIVKNPWLCDTITEVLNNDEIIIDHAFIPYRDLKAAAKSRIYVQESARDNPNDRSVPGGLWHTKEPSMQDTILSEQFYKLVTALGEASVPMTFLSYPRLVNDPRYTYQKLGVLLRRVSYFKFERAFGGARCPEFIHQFTENDC